MTSSNQYFKLSPYICYCNIHFLQACEEVLSKLKNSYGSSQLTHQTLRSITNPALYPLIQGCETKDPKLTKVFIFFLDKKLILLNKLYYAGMFRGYTKIYHV
jgi:hypothetical protein